MGASHPAELVERTRLVETTLLPVPKIATRVGIHDATVRRWIAKRGWSRPPGGTTDRRRKIAPSKHPALRRLYEGGAKVRDLAVGSENKERTPYTRGIATWLSFRSSLLFWLKVQASGTPEPLRELAIYLLSAADEEEAKGKGESIGRGRETSYKIRMGRSSGTASWVSSRRRRCRTSRPTRSPHQSNVGAKPRHR
jgi:hypothetical protein